ncbi:aldo/keto reductase [Caldiplasma sukawensis]
MERLKIGGRTDLEVSHIGMGLWQASSSWNGEDDKIIEAVGEAKKTGINFLDTAELYGNGHSEKILGKALQIYGKDGLVIATKVAGAHLRYKELKKAAEASMERLGVKKIDLYQIHWPDPWEQIPLSHTFRAMKELCEEEKIGAIGVSNFSVRDMEEALDILDGVKIVSNQVRYNLLQREIEEEVLPFCRKNGITIIAWSPLAQGLLTGKYNKDNRPKGDVRAGNELFSTYNMSASKPLMDEIKKMSEKYSKTVSQIALNWLVCKGVLPIPGAKDKKQLSENAVAASFRLSDNDVKALDSISSEIELDYFAK